MRKLEIIFIEDFEDKQKWTEENQITYHIDIRDAVKLIKSGKAKRYFKKRNCNCGNKK